MLIEVAEISHAGSARRQVTSLAEKLHMGANRLGEIALVTTELATNLVKHAKGGQILAQTVQQPGVVGLRVIGMDKGPGIADLPRALTDGQSTTGSMGGGLGAIRRIPDRFSIYSAPGSGTVVLAEFWTGPPAPNPRRPPLEIAVVSEPIHGEEACGDGWSSRTTAPDTVMVMVVDGLGHGILAAEPARKAEKVFDASSQTSPAVILSDTHAALRDTRGAVEAIAKIELEKGLLTFAGVGNIAASILSPTSRRSMASHHGTLGMSYERVQEFTCPWGADSILVMHSDGLATRWDLESYPGIWNKAPSVIAAVLFRDFSRHRDDATVLVAKAPGV